MRDILGTAGRGNCFTQTTRAQQRCYYLSHSTIPINPQNSSQFILTYARILSARSLCSAEDLSNLDNKDKRDLFLQAMRECEDMYCVSSMELDQLASLNNWTHECVLSALNHARQAKRRGCHGAGGRINDTTKGLLREWLEGNLYRVPEGKERETLLQETGWSLAQLNHQIYQMRDKWENERALAIEDGKRKVLGVVEGEALVKQWLDDNNGRSPTRDERIMLQNQTGWTRKKITYRIRRIMIGDCDTTPLTEEAKLYVKSWLETNHNRQPSKEEMNELMHATGWARTQMNEQLRHLRETPGELSAENRMIIMNWLKEHDNDMPTIKERTELREKTGLNRRQLNAFLRSQKKKTEG